MEASREIPHGYASYLADRVPHPHRGELTPRELEVLAYLSHGLRLGDIARERGVTFHTVRDQARSARDRLAAKNLPHAVAIALRHGLIE